MPCQAHWGFLGTLGELASSAFSDGRPCNLAKLHGRDILISGALRGPHPLPDCMGWIGNRSDTLDTCYDGNGYEYSRFDSNYYSISILESPASQLDAV